MADTKQKTDSVIPTEVRELIRESQKIQGWIEKLDGHAKEARPEVFEKVRADYAVRLGVVNDQLAQHRVQLVDSLETRRTEVEALRTDRDDHAAELEEVRLRHVVGEFDDADFEKRRGKIQESLDDLDRLLHDEDETVSELDEIIAMISGAGSEEASTALAPPASHVDETPTDADSVDAEPVDETAARVASSAPEAEPDDRGAVAEPAATPVEAAVSERGPTERPRAVQKKAGKPTPEPVELEAEDDAEGGDYLDELEFLESLSLSEADRFDAVSAMLDEDEGKPASD